jgi:hypothetical protein
LQSVENQGVKALRDFIMSSFITNGKFAESLRKGCGKIAE